MTIHKPRIVGIIKGRAYPQGDKKMNRKLSLTISSNADACMLQLETLLWSLKEERRNIKIGFEPSCLNGIQFQSHLESISINSVNIEKVSQSINLIQSLNQ